VGINVSEVLQPGSQPPPTASNTWSRVARRIRVPLGFVFAIVFLWLARPTKTSLIAGALVMLPGLLLRGLASGHVQKDKQLTTSGPYAYTRNPLYLGSLILAAGFAITARSWWIVALMLLMFAVIYIPVIAGEERYLRQTFPEYDD
jgi:protein-S-isoprenylcysteine O-methyltransferase Ste14